MQEGHVNYTNSEVASLPLQHKHKKDQTASTFLVSVFPSDVGTWLQEFASSIKMSLNWIFSIEW